jgi:hypothetical protein
MENNISEESSAAIQCQAVKLVTLQKVLQSLEHSLFMRLLNSWQPTYYSPFLPNVTPYPKQPLFFQGPQTSPACPSDKVVLSRRSVCTTVGTKKSMEKFGSNLIGKTFRLYYKNHPLYFVYVNNRFTTLLWQTDRTCKNAKFISFKGRSTHSKHCSSTG